MIPQARARIRGIQVASLVRSVVVCGILAAGATVHAGTASEPSIDFERDIRPVFESTCFRCHGSERPKSDFRLDNREAALRGGNVNTNDIVPGHADQSMLIKYVARQVEDMEMPPEGKGEPLSAEQVQLLRDWIDQGAPWSKSVEFAKEKTIFTAEPVMRWIGVSGDKEAFREHYGMHEGWASGLNHFELKDDVNDRSYSVTGHVLPQDHDNRVELAVEQKDTMFARFGWEQYRKYYDNSGGYYAPYGPSPEQESFLTLDHDLHLDREKAWAEIGLIMPRYPRIVLGYEYHSDDGEKSLLQWLPEIPTNNVFNRNIFPAAKKVDSEVHLVSLDISYDLAGFLLEDRIEFEDYRLRTERRAVQPFGSLRNGVLVQEDYEQQRVMNIFRVEKQVRDWLFLSGGHLYQQLEGSGGLALNLVETTGQPALADDSVTISQWSQVGNLNAQLGPWHRFTLATGLQTEWSRREGFGDLLLGTPPFISTNVEPATIQSDIDRFAVVEHAALRFTGVPRSVLFAEARLKQQDLGQYEEQFDNNTFLRDTDATTDELDARGGFETSPWSRVSLGGHYRRRLSNNDYEHRRDASEFSGLGYSAFITENDLDTEEVEARLVMRPANWIKTTLTYQWTATDFTTAIDSAPGLPVPGGELLAGTSDANIYSIAVSLNPIRRLQLSSTFSYSQSRTVAFDNGSDAIVPYEGNVYNLLFGGTFSLSEKTSLNAQYYFSRADYQQNNETAGLPVGIAYERHGLVVGVTRRWRENISTGLQYGFFQYREPSSGGSNDYDAHAVFATFSMILQ